MEDKPSYPKKAPIHLEYDLSPEQKELSDKLVENFKNRTNCLISAVCGSGKTEIVLQVISYAIENGLKVGFAIPRTDVVMEIKTRLETIFKDNKVVDVYGGHHKQLEGDIVCLTTHQIFRYNQYFDLLILDEIDAFPYKGNETLEHLVIRSVRGSFIQMSATPSDEIIDYYKKNNYPILSLNKRYHNHPLPVPKIVVKQSIFSYLFLYETLKRFEKTNKPVFVFAPTIGESKKIYLIMKYLLKKVNFVNSKREDRKQIIEDFRNKKYQTLITTSVLERGVTVKDLQVVVFNADSYIYTKSVLVQIAGRAGRKIDAPNGEVIFIGNKKTRDMEESIRVIETANKSLSTML